MLFTHKRKRHFRLLFPCFLGLERDSGNHSFTGSGGGDLVFVGAAVDGGPFFSSRSVRAIDSAISSGLTSSPLCIRAAMSGVTRTRRTPVWNPGASKR